MLVVGSLCAVDVKALLEDVVVGHAGAVGEMDHAEHGCCVRIERIESLEVHDVVRRIRIVRIRPPEIDAEAAGEELDAAALDAVAENQLAPLGAIRIRVGINDDIAASAVASFEDIDVLSGTTDQDIVSRSADEHIISAATE